jgi:hypothetical protein
MATESVSARVDALETRVTELETDDVVTREEFATLVTAFDQFVAEVRDKAQGM